MPCSCALDRKVAITAWGSRMLTLALLTFLPDLDLGLTLGRLLRFDLDVVLLVVTLAPLAQHTTL